jgi:hypothetical protein
MFGVAEHWTDAAGGDVDRTRRQAERQHRVRVANAVLELYGLRCADWQNRFTVTGGTGKSVVVDNLGALWPAAEKLAGRPIDPLDPEVMARVEAVVRTATASGAP